MNYQKTDPATRIYQTSIRRHKTTETFIDLKIAMQKS
jgi:hypothetical protein